jgi:hypothetical protein
MENYTKIIEYKGYEFEINITLNSKIERRINGKRYHTINAKCLNYDNLENIEFEFEQKLLTPHIIKIDSVIKENVDIILNTNLTYDEIILINCGFVKNN